MTPEVDPIAGDATDRRTADLRFPGPDRHALTSTYGRKKSPNRTSAT